MSDILAIRGKAALAYLGGRNRQSLFSHLWIRALRLTLRPMMNTMNDEHCWSLKSHPERPAGQSVVRSHWDAVMCRCGEVLPLFQECRLSLRSPQAATKLGLTGREQLQKLLVNRRLPPFQLLRNWVYVVVLLDRFTEREKEVLSSWALRRGEDPRIYYRLVQQTAGHRWSQTRCLGSEWARATALTVWAPHLRDGE